MQEILAQLGIIYDATMVNGKYPAIFAMALIFLYLKRDIKDKQYLWIMPMPATVLNAGVRAFDYAKGRGRETILAIAFVLILVLSGGLKIPDYSNVSWRLNSIDEAEEEALDAIRSWQEETGSTVKILGPNKIVECARSYSGEFQLLYGKDIWMGKINKQIVDGYPKEYYIIYEYMQNQADSVRQIGLSALETRCNIIILENFHGDMKALSDCGYKLIATTDNYIVYGTPAAKSGISEDV